MMMRLNIHGHSIFLNRELRQHIERRIRHATRRFESRIRLTSVLLSDVNGPKGGADKVCRVIVELNRRDRVVLTGLGSDAFRLVDGVAARVNWRISLLVQRRRRFDRTQTIRRKARL